MKCRFLFIALCLSSCVSHSEKGIDNISSDNDTVTNIVLKEDVIKTGNNTLEVDTFKYENDTIQQIVYLTYKSKKEIWFKVISTNKRVNQFSETEGFAKLNGGDWEIDEDEEGNPYPAKEFLHEQNCWLALRIDVETGSIMRTKAADCTSDPLCPFESVGLLRKQ
jgi:hypothetical protein